MRKTGSPPRFTAQNMKSNKARLSLNRRTVFFILGLVWISSQAVANAGWTEDELAKDIAMRTLKSRQGASFHLIRLRTAEKPHVHETHDVTVIVKKGRARVHLEDTVKEIGKGDRIVILRDTVHWAENLGPDACEVYAIFRPAYDGTDYLPVLFPEK